MTTKDFIFNVFNEPHVALLVTDRVQKVVSSCDNFIRTEDGQLHFLNNENISPLVRNSIPNKFWTAESWVNKCYSVLM